MAGYLDGLYRPLDEINKTETTLEELKKSKDWKQAVILITEDTFPYNLFPEARAYLVAYNTPYFDENVEDGALPGFTIDFTTDFNPRLDLYIAGKKDITFKVEAVYKLIDLYDDAKVLEQLDEYLKHEDFGSVPEDSIDDADIDVVATDNETDF